MADWLSTWSLGDALGDAPNFDAMAARVQALPLYPGAITEDALQRRMTEHQALLYIAHRLLTDPLLSAAARRVYDNSWLIRQTTTMLLNTTEEATISL